MKKMGIVGILILCFAGILFYFSHEKQEEELLQTISPSEIENLLQEQSNLQIYAYPTTNDTTKEIEPIVKKYMKKTGEMVYKIENSKLKGTVLEKYVKDVPILFVYKKGLYKDSLEIEKKEDISLETLESFVDNAKKEEKNHKEINLDYIKREQGKVNVYLFWGDGCPHCEAEKEFWKSIEESYGKYYNLYTFETWNEKENVEIYQTFAERMNETAKAVPFTIIGSQVIKGYSEPLKEKFLNAILKEKDKNFDVYFDRIKAK